MKLGNFTKAFERMGGEKEQPQLNSGSRNQAISTRLERLNGLKNAAVQNLSKADLTQGIDNFENAVAILDWIRRIYVYLIDSRTKGNEEFSEDMKYVDLYVEKIMKAFKSGKHVSESLLKESLNYIEK